MIMGNPSTLSFCRVNQMEKKLLAVEEEVLQKKQKPKDQNESSDEDPDDEAMFDWRKKC